MTPLRKCSFIGAVHVLPLPGSPDWAGTMNPVKERAIADTAGYVDGGADAVIIENTNDVPYRRATADAATIAGMATVAEALTSRFDLPIGIQVLAAADLEAIDLAITCGLAFVRAEGFAYAHVADEGIIQGNAAELLRRRAHLGGSAVEVWADIKKKHGAHALTADLGIDDMAHGAAYCKADAVIITGSRTGTPPTLHDVSAAKRAGIPVYIGSGIDNSNLREFAAEADGLIVGTACKHEGRWQESVDPARVKELVTILKTT